MITLLVATVKFSLCENEIVTHVTMELRQSRS